MNRTILVGYVLLLQLNVKIDLILIYLHKRTQTFNVFIIKGVIYLPWSFSYKIPNLVQFRYRITSRNAWLIYCCEGWTFTENSWADLPIPISGISKSSHIELIWVANRESVGVNTAWTPPSIRLQTI